MKRNDLILILTILLFALTFWFINTKVVQKKGDYVTVSVQGEIIDQFSLDEEVDIVIEGANQGTNRLVIHDGKASILDANCPDKLCVHQKKILKNNETIVCLPNQVVIEVHAQEEKEYDAIAN